MYGVHINKLHHRRVDRMFGTFFAVPPLVEDIKSFAVLLETGSTAKPSEFIFASLSVTASFCDCLYYLLDNATWLASVDVIQMDSDRIRRWCVCGSGSGSELCVQ